MKKTLPLIIAIILVIGGLSAVGIKIEATNTETITKDIHLQIQHPQIKTINNQYLRIQLGNEESYLVNPGQPMVPEIIQHLELPFGATNIEIKITPYDIQHQTISKEIQPAPAPKPHTPADHITTPPVKDMSVYTSTVLYPSDWLGYRVGCGSNADNQHITHLSIHIFPLRYSPGTNTISYFSSADISLTYDQPIQPITFPDNYDLVIIAPAKFESYLQPLIDHKNNYNVTTYLKTTEEIYDQYEGADKPEQIKYFIKDAIETEGVNYVLLVGGLKSLIYAKPKDHRNYGAKGWHLPVRYSNLIFDEPGYLCDLYYADIYKEGGEFDNWDSNNNGIFAEWDNETQDDLDLYPDVNIGRLACRNTLEVRNVVNKIINYETTADPSWTNKMIVISGDGFLDQIDLNISWDTNGLPDGDYTIYAQSSNPENEFGPIDTINITIDKTQPTNITFNHDDHLNPALQDGYPAPPIAEIVSISEGNILGNTDYTYVPGNGEAYCNDLYFWADIEYIEGTLIIRGKSYDPKPYGNLTNIKVWIENDNEETVFTAYRNNTPTYYEGEWVTGEKTVHGRGGALYYMPETTETEIIWTSNGKYSSQEDVINAFSEGYGLAFFSGHGSPGWWGDHFPGIPGNRRYAQVAGLLVSQILPFFPFIKLPALPMRKLTNTNKLPVVVVGGCHNSMFNVSLIPTFLDFFLPLWMHTFGRAITECWSWYLIKMPKTGAIATIGNTGYGWGSEGEWCTIGVGDGWITAEFFRQYGTENHTILGDAYSQSINTYVTHMTNFTLPEWFDYGWDHIDEKTVQQWALLGDPSLKIGGYT